jgi:hypothetical protein
MCISQGVTRQSPRRRSDREASTATVRELADAPQLQPVSAPAALAQ